MRIAFLHSDDNRLFRQTIESGQWDLVCYGHTHIAKQHREGKTLVLNPGAIYRANPWLPPIWVFPWTGLPHWGAGTRYHAY